MPDADAPAVRHDLEGRDAVIQRTAENLLDGAGDSRLALTRNNRLWAGTKSPPFGIAPQQECFMHVIARDLFPPDEAQLPGGGGGSGVERVAAPCGPEPPGETLADKGSPC